MSEPDRTRHGISRRSMIVAGFSTVVEWYDFTLYYCCVRWAKKPA